MEIAGKVHCFFEQSGTFKNEFIKLGIPAEDYDIQNNFGQTDNVVDLFKEIKKAHNGRKTIFDKVSKDDLILAFFPCIHFCDAKTMMFKGVHISMKNWSLQKVMRFNIEASKHREHFYRLLLMLVEVVDKMGFRMIIENPWNTSGETYLQTNFIAPAVIDKNRSLRGDQFVKPTAYWFIGCEPTNLMTQQQTKEVKVVYKQRDKVFKKGQCSEQRSMISPDYARNFICDFILGKPQQNTLMTLF